MNYPEFCSAKFTKYTGLAGLLFIQSFSLPDVDAAQVQTAGGPETDAVCTELVENVISRTERDYIGYAGRILSDAERADDYQRHVDAVRGSARGKGRDACLYVLQRYTDWFNDGHLFITENATPEHTNIDLGRYNGDIGELRASLQDDTLLTGSVFEGLWGNGLGEFAITRAGSGGEASYDIVVIRSTEENWKTGDVRGRIRKDPNGYWELYFGDAERKFTRSRLSLHKNGLFMRARYYFGRITLKEAAQAGLVNTEDPLSPIFKRMTEDTVLVSVPSHSNEYQDILNTLIDTHHEDITAARTLIIDLRGNVGGSAMVSDGLNAYFYNPEAPEADVYDPYILGSPAAIAYYEYVRQYVDDPGTSIDPLLERLRANPGKIIRVYPGGITDPPERFPETTYDTPRNVAFLTDKGTISAGEAFIRLAAPFPRVTIFGQPTMGGIDFGLVVGGPLGESEWAYNIGIPLLAANESMIYAGNNEAGILPDVYIDPVADPIAYITGYYKN